VSAETRPLIAAEPMLRAPSPEIVSESTFGAALAATGVCDSTEVAGMIAHTTSE
jgi:hypothetical protein